MDKVMQWAVSVLLRECVLEFYGSVSFQIQNGKICGVRIEKTEKPPIENKT